MAFGEKEIEDLILPFYCVTANLTTSNADVHTVGKLWRWLRASVAIPGVIPPFNEAGEVHVDGGVIDNFPVRTMRRLGRGVTIGVDIDTGGALAAGAGVMEPWSAWQFFRRLVWKRNETLPIPSIVRILLRSALVASTARAAGGPPGGRPADRAADEPYRPARLDELRGRHRARLSHHHGSARQGPRLADRRPPLRRLTGGTAISLISPNG